MLAKIGVWLIVLISKAPYGVLYAFSDILHFIVFGIFRYRRKVILTNIRNSFPEKSSKEHKQIAKEFTNYFTDLMIESIKCFSITEDELNQRMVCSLDENYYRCLKEGKSMILVAGHHGNYEYLNLAFGLIQKRHEFLGVYKGIKNKAVSDAFLKSRGAFGTVLIETKQTKSFVKEYVKTKKPFAMALLADQAPRAEKGYWMEFLNQDTPVFFGPELFAREWNIPVFYAEMNRVKRGHYSYSIELLVENPQELEPGEVTEIHAKRLEADIKKRPEIWLWSHKRWKRKRPANLPEKQISRRYSV